MDLKMFVVVEEEGKPKAALPFELRRKNQTRLLRVLEFHSHNAEDRTKSHGKFYAVSLFNSRSPAIRL